MIRTLFFSALLLVGCGVPDLEIDPSEINAPNASAVGTPATEDLSDAGTDSDAGEPAQAPMQKAKHPCAGLKSCDGGTP